MERTERTALQQERLPPAGHWLGVAATIWSVVAIVEWYAVPALVPHEGPLPYLRFAPQLLALQFGVAAFALTVLAGRSRLSIAQRLLYTAPAFAYLAIVL